MGVLYWWIPTCSEWLKDGKDRVLEFDDILHFKKIIVALTKTDRVMKGIEKNKFE